MSVSWRGSEFTHLPPKSPAKPELSRRLRRLLRRTVCTLWSPARKRFELGQMRKSWGNPMFSGGGILVMTLVFITMFAAIFIGLLGVTSRQFRESVRAAEREVAFHIAEAGLNYAMWRLAHDPDDLSPAERIVDDPLAGNIGSYEIEFTAPPDGSSIIIIDVVGRNESATAEVALRGRYGIASFAHYGLITNEDAFYTGTLSGKTHSNGGIRMDGYSDAIVASARESYMCSGAACPSPEIKPGVWGEGQRQELWQTGVPPVDFSAVTGRLQDMKELAQTLGTYYPFSSQFGYHIVFHDDNTYTVYEVTGKEPPVESWFPEDQEECCILTSHDIAAKALVESKDVPSDGIIYFEDNVWMEGDIRDRVTVAAARFPDQPSTYVDIIINGDISYGGVYDGSRVFGAVAQRHILIPYSGAPEDLYLDGAYLAQRGRFGRRYYPHEPHNIKNQLDRYGMVASNFQPFTVWVDNEGVPESGYPEGIFRYASYLRHSPPPFFPTTGQYELLSWEQVQ